MNVTYSLWIGWWVAFDVLWIPHLIWWHLRVLKRLLPHTKCEITKVACMAPPTSPSENWSMPSSLCKTTMNLENMQRCWTDCSRAASNTWFFRGDKVCPLNWLNYHPLYKAVEPSESNYWLKYWTIHSHAEWPKLDSSLPLLLPLVCFCSEFLKSSQIMSQKQRHLC